jgi:hypothetical protein
MGWKRIDEVTPPIARPILVRTLAYAKPSVALPGNDGVWYAGGAIIISSSTQLGATPTEWCEPGIDQNIQPESRQ